MADQQETLDTLEAAMIALAQKAGAENSSAYAEQFARAAAQIAEARAWYKSPAQPHGGSSQVSVKS